MDGENNQFFEIMDDDGKTFNTSNSSLTLNESVLKDLIDSHFFGGYSTKSGVALVLVILYVPVFLAGVTGNGLLILLMLTFRSQRNTTNLLLCNLAFADLSVTFICIPVAVGNAFYKIWSYGETMCKLTGFLQGVTVAASVFTIALLSIDRFFAIRHPMLFRRLSTNANAAKLIVSVWVISIALMIPLIFVRRISTVDIIPGEPVHFCSEHWDDDKHRQHYDIALFVVVYIIPGCIICSCYGLIGSELWKEDTDLQRKESETCQGLAANMMKGRKRVAKMLIALAILFAICWLPYYIVSLYLDFHQDTSLLVVLPYTIFLGHSNSALNPILYFYSSKNFRCVLSKLFKCKKRRLKPKRRANVIVRRTRNHSNTTAALTKRAFIRPLSNECLTSRSGSLRFSRSSNNSLKSSSSTTRTSFKSVTTNRGNDVHTPTRYSKETTSKCESQKMAQTNFFPHVIVFVEASYDDQQLDNADDTYHKKCFMEATISIPTTINEESSRHNSLIPPHNVTPSQSMGAIVEEPWDSSNTERNKNMMEMKTCLTISALHDHKIDQCRFVNDSIICDKTDMADSK